VSRFRPEFRDGFDVNFNLGGSMSGRPQKRQLGWLLIGSLAVVACDQSVLATTESPSPQASASETQGALLARVRAATSAYHDVEAATAAGYIRVSPCVYSTAGATAIHYQKPPLVDAVIDPAAPEVLLYEPSSNGQLRLVGVEFLIPAAAWDASNSMIPMLGDQPYRDRRSPPFGAPFPNYAAYVWLWRHNPRGTYEIFNPKVSCEHADVSLEV
jgi:hypothetical protein